MCELNAPGGTPVLLCGPLSGFKTLGRTLTNQARSSRDQRGLPLVLVTETIIAFAWEPNGSKFAVLHGEAPRISVSFYHVKNNGKIELISKWPRPGLTQEGGRLFRVM